MKFDYQARNKEGKIETGTIEASSADAAAALLRKYNISVVSLKEIKLFLPLLKKGIFFGKVSKKDLAIFSRQLAVMIDARVPIVQSLLTLAAQIKKAEFRDDLTRISELVGEGNSFSESLAFFPNVFDTYFVNLIKSGETSGKISESLCYLSDHLEREYDITAKIKGAMIYPVLVLSVMVAVIIVVMTFVMPKIVTLLKEVGGNMPFFTKVLIGFYEFLVGYGWFLLIVFVGFIVFLVYYLRTKEGKRFYDRTSLRIPVFGKLLEKTYLMRFAENLSTLISAGLPITQALKTTKNTIGNVVYRKIVAEMEREVSEGEKISSVLARYPERVPSFVIQMIKVGEETGKIDKTLMEIVNFYQKEITRAVDAFMTLIEPILLVILGIGVGFLAISVLSPLYSMMGAM